MIKGIPRSVPHEDVKEGLQELGFAAQAVDWLKIPGTGRTSPKRVVILPDTEQHRDIFQMEKFYGLVVTVEKLRSSRGPVQCYNCQGLFHVARHCTMPPRCVRCGQGHEQGHCTLEREKPAVCCLCKGNHPANYRGCVHHKNARRRQLGLPPLNSKETVQKSVPTSSTGPALVVADPHRRVGVQPPHQRPQGRRSALIQPGLSVADVARGVTHQPKAQQPIVAPTGSLPQPNPPVPSTDLNNLAELLTTLRQTVGALNSAITQLSTLPTLITTAVQEAVRSLFMLTSATSQTSHASD